MLPWLCEILLHSPIHTAELPQMPSLELPVFLQLLPRFTGRMALEMKRGLRMCRIPERKPNE